MKIDELMTRDPYVVHPDDSLATAARLMWEHDVGALPVVAEDGRVVAMITDRDVCMAGYTQGRPLAEIPVRTAMSNVLHVCLAGDSVAQAEWVMREHRVRRLPVLDEAGHLRGILSINDLARESAGRSGKKRIQTKEIAQTLAAVSEHRHEILATHS